MPVDPTVADQVALLAPFGLADITAQSPALVAAIGEAIRPVGGWEAPEADVEDAVADGPHGPVPVRVYRAPGAAAGTAGAPGLVWVHGGGFRAGDLDMPEADGVARELAVRAGAVVVSVDYRLATGGVHYPVPLDDVVAAWRWVRGRATALGIDATRLALGGASAGACLAAGAALWLRDEDEPAPAQLLLAYPTLHRELPKAAAVLPDDMAAEIPAAMRFPPSIMASMNDNYLGDARATRYAFPGMGPLHGCPPMLIVAAEYDDLRASADAFACAAHAAGVAVDVRCEPGMPHGYLNFPGVTGWHHSLDALARRLREARH